MSTRATTADIFLTIVMVYMIMVMLFGKAVTSCLDLPVHVGVSILVIPVSILLMARKLPLFTLLSMAYVGWCLLRLSVAETVDFYTLRDFWPCVDLLWLVVGMTIARRRLAEVDKMIPRLVVIYSCLYLFSVIRSGKTDSTFETDSDSSLSVIGRPSYLLASSAIIWIQCLRQRGRLDWLFDALSIGLMVAPVLMGSRIGLMVNGILIVALFIRGQMTVRFLSRSVIYGCVIVVVANILDFRNRHGHGINFDTIWNLWLAIFGLGENTSSVGGWHQRIEWWSNALRQLDSADFGWLVGLGYGIPLTNFLGPDGQIVRELHNSFLTPLVRVGLVGFSFFICFILVLCIHIYRLVQKMDVSRRAGWSLLLAMAGFSVLFTGMSEPCFEVPQVACVVWFSLGFAFEALRNYKISQFGEYQV